MLKGFDIFTVVKVMMTGTSGGPFCLVSCIRALSRGHYGAARSSMGTPHNSFPECRMQGSLVLSGDRLLQYRRFPSHSVVDFNCQKIERDRMKRDYCSGITADPRGSASTAARCGGSTNSAGANSPSETRSRWPQVSESLLSETRRSSRLECLLRIPSWRVS